MKVAFQHPPSAALAQGRRQRGTALLLGLLAFLVYNANGRLVSSGDCYPARYLPFGILKYGTVALDPIADTVAQGDAHPYWCVKQGGHTYSRYPIAAPVLVTPLYVPAVAYLEWQGWTEERLEQTARFMEKVTAAFIASLAVGLMYLLLVRRTTCCRPLLLTVAFGFGTNTWMISGQALWQHGLAEFLLVLALFLVLGPCTAPRALATGVCLSLIAACRPPDAILAAAVGLFGLRWARGYLGLLILGVALPLLPLLAYNYSVARNLAGGYGIGINKNPFKFSLPLGLLGLLFSPTRGLFVFSPFLLFLPLGLFGTLRQARDRALGLLVVAAVVGQAAVYAKLDWRAGCSWGPRWLTDMLPFLVWLLAAGLGHLRPFGRVLFDLAVCLSIGTQVVGAFWYTGESDTAILQGAGDPGSMTAVWDVRNTPFVAEFRHGPAPRELFLTVEGSIDRVRANEVEVERITPGTDLEIEGWALTDHRTPRTVWARLVPVDAIHWRGSRQYLTGGTDSFFERPDVTATVRGQGPAGWRVVMNTEGLRPGLYRIEVKVRGNDGGEVRPVAHRALVVAEPGEHLAPPELPVRVEGSIDRIRADGCPVARLLPGTELEIEGWALTNRRSPTAIRVRLIPTEHCGGRSSWDRSVETTSLFERPDVNLGREVSVPAGWRVVVKTVGCEPGPYRLEVLAQRDTGGEFVPVACQPLRILPAELESLAWVARERLRNRQHADGYWLTVHTRSTRFDRPTPELNVFVTAMIHDVLEPVAGRADLKESQERSRLHLREQIEPTGLVRFHGRPGLPVLPGLGCVITPDADDTALAWRIAGLSEDERSNAAREVLKTYRDSRGLYRTWLAPRQEYCNIDPGEDPNPPDVGIQMHVLMWFATAEPPAARSLHAALQTVIADERTWVYYKKAPLIPLWRAADLQNLGYPVSITPERLRSVVPGQEAWVAACRQLAQYSANGSPHPAPEETRALLEGLAKDHFAAIRSNPPLLFHNDQTGRVSRYYWSEDFGYALWLRLYLEMAGSMPKDASAR